MVSLGKEALDRGGANGDPFAGEVVTRQCRPDPMSETASRLRGLMPRMGITRVADLTGLDRIGMPVVAVYRPDARSLAVAQGKGLDLASATVSGLMEAAELFHAEHIDRPLRFGSHADLGSTHAIVDVDRLAHVTQRQFDRSVVTLWIEGRCLFSDSCLLVPFECVSANFTLPPPPGTGWFDRSSNGLAAGDTREQAIRHGLCEVLERDATALWNLLSPDARALSGLDPASIDDPSCRALLSMLEAADFDVAAWETTTDTGVPSFFALIVDRRDPLSHCGIGAAADPRAARALRRALTEAVQVRTTYVSGARDDLSPAEYGEPERRRRRYRAGRLLAAHRPVRDFGGFRKPAEISAKTDIPWLGDRLASVGITDAVVVDLAKEEIGLPVVRVLVPGLEGPDDHAAYVPGERARRIPGGRT